jgi:hypothetical protein
VNLESYPSLSNKRIGFFHVLDRAATDVQGRAMYWCRCEHCGTERLVRAQNLRRGMRGRWEPRCSGCGA